uniref:Uncharacterized protein n=1 Tax=Utricularia reniformis TaxID=192314 RepID=A0A1Y0B4S1_9LAMI|nr:hypothetical protein AEK19_MT2243 [Utricularia reniformis]ART32388.1 hypothetical protein AEK19_MT2243 [Utricularia reniformis]
MGSKLLPKRFSDVLRLGSLRSTQERYRRWRAIKSYSHFHWLICWLVNKPDILLCPCSIT